MGFVLRRLQSQVGSAAVDFLLAGVMLTALALGVLQFAHALYIRNTLVDAAAEGARYAALADRSIADGPNRSAALVAESLGRGALNEARAELVLVAGVQLVRVKLTANLPLIGVWGPSGGLSVSGHAPIEPR